MIEFVETDSEWVETVLEWDDTIILIGPVQIGAAAIGLVGQSIVANIQEIVSIEGVTISYSAQSLKINQLVKIGQATISYTGQLVSANMKTVFSIGQATISLAGQIIKINQLIKIGQATISYIGRGLTVAGEFVAAVNKSWTVYKRRRKK